MLLLAPVVANRKPVREVFHRRIGNHSAGGHALDTLIEPLVHEFVENSGVTCTEVVTFRPKRIQGDALGVILPICHSQQLVHVCRVPLYGHILGGCHSKVATNGVFLFGVVGQIALLVNKGP